MGIDVFGKWIGYKAMNNKVGVASGVKSVTSVEKRKTYRRWFEERDEKEEVAREGEMGYGEVMLGVDPLERAAGVGFSAEPPDACTRAECGPVLLYCSEMARADWLPEIVLGAAMACLGLKNTRYESGFPI